jgi:hypothetical protein
MIYAPGSATPIQVLVHPSADRFLLIGGLSVMQRSADLPAAVKKESFRTPGQAIRAVVNREELTSP